MRSRFYKDIIIQRVSGHPELTETWLGYKRWKGNHELKLSL